MKFLTRSPQLNSLVLGALLILALALLGSSAQHDRWTLWAVHGLAACSLVIAWGVTGIFSLGQTAMSGLGAYAAGIVAINLGSDSGWSLLTSLVAGTAVGATFALIVGYFVFSSQVTPIQVAIITLGTTLVLFVFFNNTADPRYAIGEAKLGGFNGMVGIPKPQIWGLELDKRGLFIFTSALCLIVATVLGAWRQSRWGKIAEAIRVNERRAQLLGYDVQRHQRIVFILGGSIAGLAGALYSTWSRFDDPQLFSLGPAVLLVIWVLVGSRTSIPGAFVGVAIVEGLTSWFGGSEGEYSPIYLGTALILLVILLPNGLVDTAVNLIRSRQLKSEPTGVDSQTTPDFSQLAHLVEREPGGLVTKQMTKHFGGLAAVEGVDLEFPPTGLTSIIGPNGAGKSTLFSLLAGLNMPTSGTIYLADKQVERWKPHRRARNGIALKTQVAGVFPDRSVEENIALALGTSPQEQQLTPEAIAAIFGLSYKLNEQAGALSHGEQQWLDIAMALCTGPSVLLLDEPTAGLSPEETQRTADLLDEIAKHIHVVVIDHDMGFIRLLAAPTVVMHLGELLLQGDFETVVNDERVHDIYLGSAANA